MFPVSFVTQDEYGVPFDVEEFNTFDELLSYRDFILDNLEDCQLQGVARDLSNHLFKVDTLIERISIQLEEQEYAQIA